VARLEHRFATHFKLVVATSRYTAYLKLRLIRVVHVFMHNSLLPVHVLKKRKSGLADLRVLADSLRLSHAQADCTQSLGARTTNSPCLELGSQSCRERVSSHHHGTGIHIEPCFSQNGKGSKPCIRYSIGSMPIILCELLDLGVKHPCKVHCNHCRLLNCLRADSFEASVGRPLGRVSFVEFWHNVFLGTRAILAITLC
jgi:hypothetical protein